MRDRIDASCGEQNDRRYQQNHIAAVDRYWEDAMQNESGDRQPGERRPFRRYFRPGLNSNDCPPDANQGEDQNREPYTQIDKPGITGYGLDQKGSNTSSATGDYARQKGD